MVVNIWRADVITDYIWKLFDKKTRVIFKDKISADMLITESSNYKIEKYIGTLKRTNPKNGLKRFVKWFLEYEKK